MAAGGGKDEGKGGGESALLRLPQFSATLFDGDKPVGILSALVLLEVTGNEERATVLEQMPKLEDAFVRALHQLAETESRLNQEYGPIEIKRAFQLVADHLFGKGVVDEVLVEGVTRSHSG